MKYLSNTIKIAMLVGVVFFGLSLATKADDSKSVSEKLHEFQSKVVVWLENEKNETIEFQRKSWASAKEQNARNFSKIKKFLGLED